MKSLLVGGLSALLVMGLGPLATGATAQVFSSQRDPSVTTQEELRRGGGELQAALEREETLYLSKNGTYDQDLVLRSEATIGTQRLPVGTVIRGRFEPAEGGLVYVANSVEITDRIYQINAVSEVMRSRKDPRETSTGAILTDAAIGALGGYVLGEVFGRPDLLEVVGGAAAGVLVGSTTAPSVVVVRPDDPIVLVAQNSVQQP